MTDNSCENISGIHVSVRIRPLSQQEINNGRHVCCQNIGNSTVVISKEGDSCAYLKSQTSSIHEYAFDAVFDHTSTQEDVYNKSAKPYVNKAIIGENVTIFAYGTTGAGKTHTMFGNTRMDSTSNVAGGGVIPQTIQDLFIQINQLHDKNHYASTMNDNDNGITSSTNHDEVDLLQFQPTPSLEQQQQQETWSVSFSYMEVYNEQVCDLLEPMNGKDLPLREDPNKGIVHVVGLTEFPVKNYDEVIELLMKGQSNRKTEATKANAVSSRSHAIIQFTIVRTKVNHAGQKTFIESKLSLIDLAGSERASVTQSTGMRLQEGSNINKSLLALANCISALAERSSSEDKSNILRSPSVRKSIKVKYRDSKLTHLLKGSLEGNCNLVMIANVNPADDTYDDTYHTLCYANRAKNLKVNPLIREQFEEITADKQLKLLEENNLLKSKIAELQATVQMLMEHKDRSSMCSSSVASSSVESYSRRSTIDSISTGATSYHQPTNMTLIQQNTRGNSSSSSSITSIQESSSNVSKKNQKRQSNPSITSSIASKRDKPNTATTTTTSVSSQVIHNKNTTRTMGPPLHKHNNNNSSSRNNSNIELYQNDMKPLIPLQRNSTITSNIDDTASLMLIIPNTTTEEVESDTFHHNLLLPHHQQQQHLYTDNIILEQQQQQPTTSSSSSSNRKKRTSLSLSNHVVTELSSNKENELGNYVYPADPRNNNTINNNNQQQQQPVKTRRISNDNPSSTSITMAAHLSDRCDSIDGFAMIANEKQHFQHNRLSNETNHRESNCSELTMEDNQSIGKLSFGTLTVDPRENNLSLDHIPIKEGNRNHLEISNPSDIKKPKFLTRFLCGINHIKKIRKI